MPLFRLSPEHNLFPPVQLSEPEGLLAVGGDLSCARLVEAYRNGIFPWYEEGSPILWWSPDPRSVILPGGLHVPRSVDRLLKRNCFSFSINRAFGEVIQNCARSFRPGQDGTWLLPEMRAAYILFHKKGYAHSIEAWQDGELAGGFYGVAIGRAFFGESMFYRKGDASKAAFAWFARRFFASGHRFIDCQQDTEHMRRFGSELMDRQDFMTLLSAAVKEDGEPALFADAPGE